MEGLKEERGPFETVGEQAVLVAPAGTWEDMAT